jgi:hypothetical protein
MLDRQGETMPGTTISGSHANVTLTTPSYVNPITVSGTVTGTSAAIEGIGLTSWTIGNSGTIAGATVGIKLDVGGQITNQIAGTISGGSFGVSVYDIQGFVINDGHIQGGTTLGSAGVLLNAAGTVANASGATITGFTAISVLYAAGTVVNDGTLTGSGGPAIGFYAGGRVTNHAGGLISGATNGITGKSGATLVNAGTVRGGAGNAGVDLPGGGMVTNQSGGTIAGGAAGVEILYSGATVDNAGSISGSGTGANGVTLLFGGYVTNHTAGIISGYASGVEIYDGAGTVVNAGSIVGTGTSVLARGVILAKGGALTNQAGAVITGLSGIYVYQAPGTIINDGKIITTGNDGINMNGGGVITNRAGGTISGYKGIYIGGNATVINAGTIAGSHPAYWAVYFGMGSTHLLTVDPGAVFIGNMLGGNSIGSSAISTLEFGSAASTGTFAAIGSHYVDFARVTIDNNASWVMTGYNTLQSGGTFTNGGALVLQNATFADQGVLQNDGVIQLDPSTLTVGSMLGSGSVTIAAAATLHALGTVVAGETIVLGGVGAILRIDNPLQFAGTIDGFASKRTIELTTVAHAGSDSAQIIGTNTLEVVTGSGTFDLQLDPSQSFAGKVFGLSANGGGSDINVACFAAGTHIATERGMVAVEALREGDVVRTVMRGGWHSIIWLGHRRIDCRRHRDPAAVWPICVRTGAFGHGRPFHDLYLSPEHAVLIDGVLIPIRCLVDGQTIVQRMCDTISYWHVELAEHNVIYAEGVPAESYLDTGDRSAFHNGGRVLDLHADFASRIWEARGCAELVLTGQRLSAVKRRLAEGYQAWSVTSSTRRAGRRR